MSFIKIAVSVLTAMLVVLFTGAVCHAEDEIKFTYLVQKNRLHVYLHEKDDADYSMSINGGTDYIPFPTGKVLSINYLPSGTYQLCLKRDDDKYSVTDNFPIVMGDGTVPSDKRLNISVRGKREKEIGQGSIYIELLGAKEDTEYLYSLDGGFMWAHLQNKKNVLVEGLYSGNYDVKVRSAFDKTVMSDTVKVTVPSKINAGMAYIPLDAVKQLPELPTGCEVTSLSMVLSYYGFNISKTVLADVFLPKADYRTADYREYFVGDPREIKAYGCYAGVIKECAEKFLWTVPTRDFDVVDLSGCEPETLYSYLDMGYPVIVWATGGLGPTSEGPSWIDQKSGKIIKWVSNEHCMTLIGYNKNLNYVFVNDPMKGMAAYDIDLFEKRFEELEKQAILIVETTDG